MTGDGSRQTMIWTFLGVFVSLPLLMMGIVMPVMVLTGSGLMSVRTNSLETIFLFLLPIGVLLSVGYLLYVRGDARPEPKTDDALDELRAAYARGDVSDEEFETRRDRLR